MLEGVIETLRGTVPFGTTETGINWVKKALHPAGDGVVAGIPDGFSRPSAKYSIMSTAVVTAPSGIDQDTWDADVVLFHNPLLIGYVHTIAGANDVQYNLYNPQIYPQPPTDINLCGAGLARFASMAETYRPLYYSVTLTPIASTLTNQGSILIAQYPQKPRLSTIDTTIVPDDDAVPSRKGKEKSKEVRGNAPSDLPAPREFHTCSMSEKAAAKMSMAALAPVPANMTYTYVRSQCESYPAWYSEVNALTGLPNTYVGAFREGGYAVMKLSSNFENWMSTRDVRYYSGAADSVPFELYPALLERLINGTSPSYPYVWKGVDTSTSNLAVLPRCESNVIHMSLRGLDKQAQFKLTIRVGWELEVLPQSSIAPFVGGPSPPDLSAMEAYSRIILRLKDGYPEAYNSWEKLVDVIETASDAAGVVIPGASMIGKAARWLYNLTSGKGKKMNKEAVKTTAEKQAEIAAKTAAVLPGKKLVIERPVQGASVKQIKQAVAAGLAERDAAMKQRAAARITSRRGRKRRT